MINKIILGLSAVTLSFVTYAQPNGGGDTSDDELQLNTITTAVPFLQITPDSRSGAMGDAGTALSGSSYSMFWNTSMLTQAKEDFEISLSYSPWLQRLTGDIHISYLAGYKKLNERNVVGGSLRYFSLGEIVFTDNNGTETIRHTPTEFELAGGYGFKLNDNFALGLNGKFIFSNLTAGINVGGAQTKAGLAGAADLSFSYVNDDVDLAAGGGAIAFGLTLNNIGNKISYTELDQRDFLPTNLKLGTALTFEIDSYNKVNWATDLTKLLVPTPPQYLDIDGDGDIEIVAGKDPNVGVVAGILQSFGDAPGVLATDSDGDYIQNSDGTYETVKGTKFKEELTEINIGTGFEYWYNDLFAARAGYFFENRNKGARQHLTFGVGLKYNVFGIDFSYLASIRQNNPLANTIRFSLRMQLGARTESNSSVRPE